MRQSDAELFGVETSSGEESPLGIFDLVDFADYLALDAVNNSRLKQAAKSQKHYRHAVENPQPIKSDALRFGSLVHHRKLEPESFRERYHVIPDFSDQVADMKGNRPKNPKATKEYKVLVERERTKAKKAKKEIVTAEDYDRMMGAVDAINDKESAARCFRRGKPEQTIVWREGDLLCKARPDYWQPSTTGGADRFIDLKTTQDATDFGRTIAKFDYHRQAAWYLRGARAVGLDVTEFVFVAVESTAPHGVVVAPLHPEAIEVGADEVERLLKIVQSYHKTGICEDMPDPDYWRLPGWKRPKSKPLVIKHKGRKIKV